MVEARATDQDAYVDSILKRVPLDIQATLTREQWDGFRQALEAKQNKRHMIDARFTIPLFFTRLYCVILMGKDRRFVTQKVVIERRVKARRTVRALYYAGLTLAIVLAALMALYTAKCAANIDFIKGFHLFER